jgi:probable F420-dependent oxidoreductase
MIIDTTLPPVGLDQIAGIARAAERLGFDALWSNETQHDPFLPGALIAEHTQKLHFGTAVAIAFARSPANLAYTAWDLAQVSGGRFILGLGTQVKAHIERRFGQAWPDSPVNKLREQIAAVRAFWRTWQSGEPLNFRGEYYKLTLMTPFFNPGPVKHPDIPIYIAGVNKGLARLAGETADGFHAHAFHTPRYLAEVVLPAIRQGAENAGRLPSSIQVAVTVFVVTSSLEEQFARQQIAFYASTPSYRPVMALHGWESAAESLSALAARGRWDEMPGLINDEMLAVFAVVTGEKKLAGALRERYTGLADRLALYTPFVPGQRDSFWQELIYDLSKKS